MSHSNRRLCPIALPLLLSLTACVHYTPQPIAPAATIDTIDRRTVASATGLANETDLLAAAIRYAPSLRDTAATWRNAVAAAKASRVRPLGTLTLSAEYSHQDNPHKPWLGGAALDLPLDIGERRSTRIDAADLAIVQARYDYAEALWQTRAAIRRGLIEWRAANAEIVLDDEAVTIKRERADRLDRRVKTGEDPQSVALTAHADRSAAERRAAGARGRRSQAIAALARATGVPAATIATLSVAAETDPLPPSAATIAAWRRDAALGRSDLLRAMVDYDLAEGAVRAEVAKQYPEIHIGPGYIYERGLTKLPFNLGLVLPPSDFNRAAIREAEARRAAAGTKVEGIQAGIVAVVDGAASALATAADTVRRSERQDLPTASRMLDQARRSLNAGEGDRVDELAARAALIDAEIATADTRRQLRLARADLDDAARPPLAPDEAAIFKQAMESLETSK